MFKLELRYCENSSIGQKLFTLYYQLKNKISKQNAIKTDLEKLETNDDYPILKSIHNHHGIF